MNVGPKRLAVLAAAAVLTVAACGSSGATSAPSAAPSSAASAVPSAAPSSGGGNVTGSIAVSGSSTVEPISTGVAEAFKAQNGGFNFSVEGPGTGDGFKRFCAGEIDIADASRAIREAEKALCDAAGITFVELKVAYDGITVMTGPNNTGVTCLSYADLYALLGPESQGFDKWSAAAGLAKELGSSTTFPDADLVVTGPGEESGTFDYFNESVIQPIAVERKQVDSDGAGLLMRPDYTSSANDNVIIEGITGSDSSLGWVGFAFAEENADKIKELQVAKEVNGTCVAPSRESISDASYPLARPLLIYVNVEKAASNPAVGAYVDFYLAPGTIESVLKTVPYVNLPTPELDASRTAWESR
jgi:phosphate transport system substrate-binding protein